MSINANKGQCSGLLAHRMAMGWSPLFFGFSVVFFLLTMGAVAQQQNHGAELHVTTDPADATVIVNNDPPRPAPLSLADIAPGKHLVVVRKNGFRDYRVGIDLLPGQRESLQIKMEPLVGLVLVHSEPSDADILIDGAHRGKTPALLTDLRLGVYRLQVSKQGYRSREIELTVDDRTPQWIRMSLLSDTAVLRISSTPAGARIRINSLDRGTTPARIANIPEGQSLLEVEMQGYRPFKEPVRVVAGEDRDLSVTLQPVPAKLTLVSLPPGARIYVNDEYKGDAPVALETLLPGRYRLRAEMEGHAVMARTVELARASERVEEFRLQANVGALRIETMPPGIEVVIDGKSAGTTQGDGPVSLPLLLENIPIGERSVVLQARDRHEKRFTVVIERGQTATAQHRLERKFVPDYEIRTATGRIEGVLVEIKAGQIKLELAPGVFRTYEIREIRDHRPMK